MAAIGKLIFQFFIIRLYKVYLLSKNQLELIFRPSKGKILYLFSTRYLIHVFVVVLTIIIATNNLSAQEVNEETGQKSLLAALVDRPEGEMIIETSEAITESGTNLIGENGSVVGTLKMDEGIESVENAFVTQEGAIVKPNLAFTTVSERPRDDVIYHEVQEGETVSEIAERYNISSNTILWENKLGPRDFIKPGQKLTILPASGVSYQVKKGDTLDKISKQYNVTVDEIVEFNKLASTEAIGAEQILILPGGTPPAPPAPPVQPRSRFASVREFFNPNTGTDATPNFGTKLQWPTTSRRINQYFTWRHSGIDIDGESTSPIYASETGRVESVGWGGGYGIRIIVNHGNGLKTLYAHLSKASVRVGDSVSRGQYIGTMGCTGWCTGSHVHFEVFIGGRKVNPLGYL